MIKIPHLEWHVTHSCNFTCQGCGHYTNDGYREDIDIKTLEKWYSAWNTRIRPTQLCMLGGEPLLNKNLVDIIYMTKDIWNIKDDQEFELISNGLLFDRNSELPRALIDTQCILTITKHSEDPNYVRLFDKAINFIEESGVTYRIHDASNYWLKTYTGHGCSIEPIGSDDYKASWNNCPAGQENFILQDSKIYKCAALAYLPVQKQRYGNKLSAKWDPYLKYIPLSPDATDLDVLEFFTRTAEPVCSMCPKHKNLFAKETPLHSPRYMRTLYESN
jgi:organic radical activating enzyme